MEEIIINTELVNRDVLSLKSILVVDENGVQLGIMPPNAALSIAEERGYDLVCIAPKMSTPVCKILDYGKYKFQQQKKEKLAKKHATKNEVKEIQISATIATHDMEVKAKKVKEFLADGDYVRIVMRLRGREVSLIDYAKDKFNKFLSLCGVYSYRKPVSIEGRDIQVILEKKR